MYGSYNLKRNLFLLIFFSFQCPFAFGKNTSVQIPPLLSAFNAHPSVATANAFFSALYAEGLTTA